MSSELSRKKLENRLAAKRPHRKSHTQFDVKRQLNKKQDVVRTLPRKTLKQQQSLALEFAQVSASRRKQPSDKANFVLGKRKPSIDHLRSNKQNVHPNIEPTSCTTSKRKARSKPKLEDPTNYHSLRQVVSELKTQVQWLQQHTQSIEQQNQVLYRQIQSIDKSEKVSKFIQEQTKKKMQQLQKLCQKNQKTLCQIQNHMQKQSKQLLSNHQKDSLSTNYREPKKTKKQSCITLAQSIRRKLIR